MDILIDTHIFLWWDSQSSRLAPHETDLIAKPENRIYVSAASIWEIAIKRRLGKLSFSGSLVEAIRANSFVELAMTGADCEAAGELAWTHSEPFDRMIVAQAQRHHMTLITADEAMQAFIGVAVVSGAH